jgi:hypothetical protein
MSQQAQELHKLLMTCRSNFRAEEKKFNFFLFFFVDMLFFKNNLYICIANMVKHKNKKQWKL